MPKARFLIPLILAVFSCKEPPSEEMFVRAEDAPGGVYTFELPLTDTLRSYTVEIYGRFDGDEDTLFAQASLEADLLLHSPSDSLFGEKIWLLAGEENFFSSAFRSVWRKGIIPSERGVWRLDISVPDRYDALRGIGVVLSHTDM